MAENADAPVVKRDYTAEWKVRVRNQLILAAVVFSVFIAQELGLDAQGNVYGVARRDWLTIFLGIVVLALWFSHRNLRCPACDKYIGKQFLAPECRFCGVRLKE